MYGSVFERDGEREGALGGIGGKSQEFFTPQAYACLETVLGSSIMPAV